MSGLLRRLTRRRPATADETGTPDPASSEPAGATAETPAEPGGDQPVATTGEQATQVLPATGEQTVAIPVRDLPAGVDPTEYADAPPEASAPRGKLRRRLRYLRRVRDLLLRDLGGFTFEIHRTAGDKPEDGHRRLAQTKIERIAALDAEVRALEARLGEPHEAPLLREPGIGGVCPECGELHASDAHYCARCGAPLDAKARARRDAAVAAAAQPTTGSHAVAEPAPASVLWAAGPRPAAPAPTTTEAEGEAEPPRSEVTSEWLTLPPKEQTAEPEEPPAADAAPTVADEPKPKPKRAPRAKKPPAAAAPAEEEPKLEPAGEEPTFEPAPNGRPAEDTHGDPLASRPDQGT